MEITVKYNDLERKIIDLIAFELSVNAQEIHYNSDLYADFGIDSLDMFEIVNPKICVQV